MVVENRGGAGGSIAASAVAKANPDGYTLLVITNGMYAVNPLIYKTLPYDPNKDFAYIAMGQHAHRAGGERGQPPQDAARPDQGGVRAGRQDRVFDGGRGLRQLPVLEVLQQATGVKMLHVPYKSGAESLTAVMSGNTDVTAISAVTATAISRPARSAPTRSLRRAAWPTCRHSHRQGSAGSGRGGRLAVRHRRAGTPPEVVARA